MFLGTDNPFLNHLPAFSKIISEKPLPIFAREKAAKMNFKKPSFNLHVNWQATQTRMSMKLLHKSADEAVSIYFHEQHRIILAKLAGNVPHEDYKTLGETVFNAVREYSSMKLLYDLSEMTKSELSSRSWFTTNYLPRLFRTYGTHFSAGVVRSSNMFENISSEFLAKGAMQLGFKGNVAFFNSQRDAQEWLVKQPEQAPK